MTNQPRSGRAIARFQLPLQRSLDEVRKALEDLGAHDVQLSWEDLGGGGRPRHAGGDD